MTVHERGIAEQKLPPSDTACMGRRDDGTYCQQSPGWGTDHPGNGRCKLHGGSSLKGAESALYKHGRYSLYAGVVNSNVAEKLLELEQYDAYDIIHELQLQRALLMDFAEKKEAFTSSERDLLMKWAEQISRTAERMTRMRNDTAMTAAELKLIAARLADAVARHMPDDADAQARFLADLLDAMAMTAPK